MEEMEEGGWVENYSPTNEMLDPPLFVHYISACTAWMSFIICNSV
jgi:hypothetical protein